MFFPMMSTELKLLAACLSVGATLELLGLGVSAVRKDPYLLLRFILIPLLLPLEMVWYLWSRTPTKYSKELLLKLLKDQEKTAFGVKHDFASIKNMDDYRKKVPLMDSNSLRPYVERIRSGEEKVLFMGQVKKYFLTSGTSSGIPNIIPCTSEELKFRGFLYGPLLMAKVLFMLGPGTVCYRGMSALMSSRGEANSEFKTESPLRVGVKQFSSPATILWTAPTRVNELPDVKTSYFLQWIFALAYKDTAYIFEEFSSKFMYLVNVLLEHHEEIFTSIETGLLPKKGVLKIDDDSDDYQEISKSMQKLPGRAHELRAIFEASVQRGHKGLVQALLPNLRYIGCICTGSFSVYENSIRHYIGDTPIYNTAFGQSEAYVGRSIGLDDDRYVLCPTAGVFEFIPQSKEEAASHTAETKLFDELVPGNRYEIISTTRSGLYRLRSRDIIECTDYQNKLPCFRFLYRDGTALNLCAENVSHDQLRAATKKAQEKLNVVFNFYSVIVDYETSPPRYRILVELAKPFQAQNTKEVARKIEGAMARELCSLNPRYKQRVSSGRISHPAISFVESGCYADLEQVIYKEKIDSGLSYGQVKIPTLMKDENHGRLIDFLKARTIKID